MDGNRFDDMSRKLAAGVSRRAAVKAAAAALLGAIGVRRVAGAQVTQATCGNVVCASNPGICKPGCVCCAFSNGNSRCMPPGNCSGTVVGPGATTTTPPPRQPRPRLHRPPRPQPPPRRRLRPPRQRSRRPAQPPRLSSRHRPPRPVRPLRCQQRLPRPPRRPPHRRRRRSLRRPRRPRLLPGSSSVRPPCPALGGRSVVAASATTPPPASCAVQRASRYFGGTPFPSLERVDRVRTTRSFPTALARICRRVLKEPVRMINSSAHSRRNSSMGSADLGVAAATVTTARPAAPIRSAATSRPSGAIP